MNKVKSDTSGKIHFSIGKEVSQGKKINIACQGKEALATSVTRETPITCKRCFTQRVHDVPTALAALGLREGVLVASLYYHYGDEAEAWFDRMPGTQYINYRDKNATDQKADDIMADRLEQTGRY